MDDLLTRQRQLQASYKNDGTEPDVIRYAITVLKEQCDDTCFEWSLKTALKMLHLISFLFTHVENLCLYLHCYNYTVVHLLSSISVIITAFVCGEDRGNEGLIVFKAEMGSIC